MTTNSVKGLSGLILASPNPNQLAGFYQKVLGIPLELRSHGGFGDHWECDFDDVHFAVLKQGPSTGQDNPIVPSFYVDNIEAFVEEHGLVLSYPLMNLGEGNFVGEISDPDGNPIRLWMHKK
jgi:predicted enzyme related to lactoylglutathione lyase